MFTRTAIGIYKPHDVRPILQAYHGKDIPLEYAKKETEARNRHIAEWKSKKGLSSSSITMSSLFGMSTDVSVSAATLISVDCPQFVTVLPLAHPANIP